MANVNEVLNQAWAIQQQGRPHEAERVYRHVLEQLPNHAATWCYLGIALYDQQRYPDSEQAYRRAIELQPTFPVAWNNLGNTLRILGKAAEAEEAFGEALAQQPGYATAIKNRGTLRAWTGDLEGAIAAFEEALQLSPDDPELHRNIGVIKLLLGDFKEGWLRYRARWRMPGFHRPVPEARLWDGSDPAGKTFLLYPEQGLGDCIHFVRMAAYLQHRGARTHVLTTARMMPLLQHVEGIDMLLLDGTTPLPSYDFHGSFIDIADRAGIEETTIPAQQAYLHPAADRVAAWAEWLQRFEGKRVGICWQGNPGHQADAYRSIPLSAFEPLSAIAGVKLISLQQGYGSEQLQGIEWADRVARLPEQVDQAAGAFIDTAAIARNLDLVVTSDTALAHVAGSVGARVWLALPHVPDWRWLLDREDSPWYPTMRLFRQPAMHDWESVFAEIATALAAEG